MISTDVLALASIAGCATLSIGATAALLDGPRYDDHAECGMMVETHVSGMTFSHDGTGVVVAPNTHTKFVVGTVADGQDCRQRRRRRHRHGADNLHERDREGAVRAFERAERRAEQVRARMERVGERAERSRERAIRSRERAMERAFELRIEREVEGVEEIARTLESVIELELDQRAEVEKRVEAELKSLEKSLEGNRLRGRRHN